MDLATVPSGLTGEVALSAATPAAAKAACSAGVIELVSGWVWLC